MNDTKRVARIRLWTQLAEANVSKHIGNVVNEESTAEEVREEVLTLASDALYDAECPLELIPEITKRIVDKFVQTGKL